jgi:hypothetical protein
MSQDTTLRPGTASARGRMRTGQAISDSGVIHESQIGVLRRHVGDGT